MNYLLPQGLATVATEHHKRMVEKHKAKLLQIQHERLAGLRNWPTGLRRRASRLNPMPMMRVTYTARLCAAEIVRALKQHDVTVTPDQVRLKGPLKELGLYTVEVHLGQDIEAQLKVWVVPTVGESEAAKPEAKEGKETEAKGAESKGGLKPKRPKKNPAANRENRKPPKKNNLWLAA